MVFLAAAVFIIVAGIKLVSEFIGPLIMAGFAAIFFSIISNWLMIKGFSTRIANMISFALFIIIIAGMFLLLGLAISPLIDHLPEIEKNLNANMDGFQSLLNNSGISVLQNINVKEIGGVASSVSFDNLSAIINKVSTLFIVIFTTLFLLLEANGLSRKIKTILGTRNQEMLSNVQEFGEILVEYLIIRTKVNLTIGIAFTIALYILGVDGALMWGFLMFMFGYIPYVGFILALIPPAFVAWIEISPLTAAIVIIIAVAINSIVENLVFPQLAGKSLQLSPAMVFISLLFWGFLLGGSGFMLGVPLTVLVYTILRSSEQTKWIAYLIGPDPGEEAPDNTSGI